MALCRLLSGERQQQVSDVGLRDALEVVDVQSKRFATNIIIWHARYCCTRLPDVTHSASIGRTFFAIAGISLESDWTISSASWTPAILCVGSFVFVAYRDTMLGTIPSLTSSYDWSVSWNVTSTPNVLDVLVWRNELRMHTAQF